MPPRSVQLKAWREPSLCPQIPSAGTALRSAASYFVRTRNASAIAAPSDRSEDVERCRIAQAPYEEPGHDRAGGFAEIKYGAEYAHRRPEPSCGGEVGDERVGNRDHGADPMRRSDAARAKPANDS